MNTTASKVCDTLNKCLDLRELKPKDFDDIVDYYLEIKDNIDFNSKVIFKNYVTTNIIDIPIVLSKIIDTLCKHYNFIKIYDINNKLIKITLNERTESL